jgi:FMN reductase
MRLVVVVGNPKPDSRTLHAARLVAEKLGGRPAVVIVDLALLGARVLDREDVGTADAIANVRAADLLVVGSPTYKGAYTGLLKVFLDHLSGGALAGVVAVPVMLGGDLRHSLAPEVFLKPVLAELGASCPTRGLFLRDSEIGEPPVLEDWLELERSRVGALAAGSGA